MAFHVTDKVIQLSIQSHERCCQNRSISPDDILISSKTISAGCNVGDNFLGQIFRVLIEYSLKNDATVKKQVQFIVKILDHEQPNGAFLEEMKVYEKESFSYQNLLPKMHEVAKGDRFSAQCYYVQEEPIRLIVLQDLKASGFVMGDRQTGVDYRHCQLAMKKLASFHAASMVLAEKSPEIVKSFNNGMTTRPKLIDGFFKGFLDATIDVVESSEAKEDLQRLLPKLRNIQDHHREAYKMPLQTNRDLFQVINHGDMWVNNIMFKYDRGEPVDILFVDFQISFYTSPGYDLNYFLMMSPDSDTRMTKEESLLEVYREEFNKKLKEYQYSKEFTLTKELLQRVVVEKALYGFVMMLTLFPAILQKESSAKDTIAIFVDEHQRKRVFRQIMAHETFDRYLRFYLRKFDRLGVLDIEFKGEVGQ